MYKKKILPFALAAIIIGGLGIYLYAPFFFNKKDKAVAAPAAPLAGDREQVLEYLQKKTEDEQNSLVLPKAISPAQNPKNNADEVEQVVWQAEDEQEQTEFFASPLRTMKVMQGSPVKLVLKEEAMVDGLSLKKGTKLLGTAVLKGDRCHIFVTAAEVGKRTKKINMLVLGLDYQEGIYCKDLRGELYEEAERAAVDEILDRVYSRSFRRAAALSKTLYSTYRGGKRQALLRKTLKFYVSVIEEKK